ncbi:putative Transposase-containing protein 20 [Homarus americanus]|uniref:Putative Transposase-containing protein 20 n=1 Tax=Homarus americanus TaxID=6706 RepID=A0A8J5JZB4_HOMAM|nr:putative Transposase-containing protein 20 [Homarus americanus]
MSRRVTTRDDIAAVIALYKANHVLKEISAQTGVALRVVQNLVKRFRDLGEDELPAPLPKSGRPKLLSPRTLEVISRQVRSNPSLTAHEVKERNPRLLSHVSLRCVQQAVHDGPGFKSFRARRKPLLTKRQKENRVKFCKKYEVWDLETWRRTISVYQIMLLLISCEVQQPEAQDMRQAGHSSVTNSHFSCAAASHHNF